LLENKNILLNPLVQVKIWAIHSASISEHGNTGGFLLNNFRDNYPAAYAPECDQKKLFYYLFLPSHLQASN